MAFSHGFRGAFVSIIGSLDCKLVAARHEDSITRIRSQLLGSVCVE